MSVKNKEYYSPLKLVHHVDRVKRLKAGNKIFPTQVMLNTYDICNHKCTFCYTNEVWFKRYRDMIPTERVLSLIDEFAELNIRSIHLTGGGEPTLHPGFEQIIERLDERQLKVGLVTNGTRVDEKTLPHFGCAEWVRFSIDAASEAVYREYHGQHFSLQKTIDRAVALKKRWPHIVVGYSFVITQQNHKEIADAAMVAKEAGFDNIRITPAHTTEGQKHFEGIWDECVRQIRLAKELSDDDFQVFAQAGRIDDLKSPQEKENHFTACHYQHFVAYVGADGGLYPCCELQKGFSLGNILEESFRSAWEKRDPIALKKCPRICFFSRQNSLIEYMMLDEPAHVDFV